MEITSNNTSRISVPKTLHKLATATFSSSTCGEIMDTLWWRCNDSAAGNWKHGLKALQALAYLLVNGSERVVSETIQNIHNVLPFVKYENKSLNSQRIEQSKIIDCISYYIVQLYSQRTYRLIMETQRLQHERARVNAKRVVSKHENEDEEHEEETDVITPEITETTKMVTLDLIKAIDQSFDDINATLRPSVDILSPELATVASVKTDIFASRAGGSSANCKCIYFHFIL